MTWPTRNSSGPRPHTSDPQLRRNFGGSKSSTTSEARAQQHPLRAAGGSLATEQREAQENLPTSSAVGGSASSKRRETQADHSGPGRCQPATFERRPRAHGQSQPMTCAYTTHAYQLQFSSVLSAPRPAARRHRCSPLVQAPWPMLPPAQAAAAAKMKGTLGR